MAAKPDNISTFYSKNHGYVSLVKRSIGRYKETLVQPAMHYTRQPEAVIIIEYWRGQLVHDWVVCDNGEEQEFSKGRVIWLNIANFSRIDDTEYLQSTDI